MSIRCTSMLLPWFSIMISHAEPPHNLPCSTPLKGKISSGIEGALASTLNRDFNWKQRSEMILCIFFYVFKVYLSNIDSETAEIYFKKSL